MEIQRFAQKGIVLNDKREILLIRYAQSKFLPDKLNGKYALPGGKVEMGETHDESIVKEIEEETGIVCTPLSPIYCWNWEYKKGDDLVQINAVMRFCKYMRGEPRSSSTDEKELKIDWVGWVPMDELNKLPFVFDEKPGVNIFLKNHEILKNLL